MNQINWITLLTAEFGAAKLALQPFGVIIPDENINALVNGISAAVTIGGIIYNHFKKAERQHPFDGGVNFAQSANVGDHGPSI